MSPRGFARKVAVASTLCCFSSRLRGAPRSDERLIKEVHHELVTLPFYSVVDNMSATASLARRSSCSARHPADCAIESAKAKYSQASDSFLISLWNLPSSGRVRSRSVASEVQQHSDEKEVMVCL
jgi:hypothetical protein